jgi:hypothetical protein
MLKVNTDPNCPGADIRKGDSVHTWETVHQDRGKHSMSSIPKARWEEIFGPRGPGMTGEVALSLNPGETWTPETMRKAMKAHNASS